MPSRAVYTLSPSMRESGRAKYTYSKTHRLCRGAVRARSQRVISPPSRRTISPGATSRRKEKPQLSRAQDSEATAAPWGLTPRHRGR